MHRPRFDPGHDRDGIYRQYAEKLGYAGYLLAKSAYHARLPLAYLETTLRPAIMHHQIRFFFDDGEPCGYIIWARLAEDVEERFIQQNDLRLHPSEWNEGSSLWIVDLLIPPGLSRSVIAYLRDDLFRTEPRVRYVRFRRDGLVIKEARRNVQSLRQANGAGGTSSGQVTERQEVVSRTPWEEESA
ncbi:toxin-activating lysine-acyltransferase [Xanthomonas albilineans]|uniref:toxin-activating lysine-acyltransferase n=1 Tax=Xanthomonas albilineans TaxID=29447 RepID=UPI000695AAD6|nr:toxin-activating lysine-acyltransferase [Xanthomonas albilineans]